MITHILSNLPEEYTTIIKILKDELNDNNDSLAVEMINFNQMNEHSRPRASNVTKLMNNKN